MSKGVFGGEVYAAPADPESGPRRLRPLGSVMSMVTDGVFLPDGDHLVLRDYGRAVVYTWPGLDAVEEIALPAQRQGEGIAVAPGGRSLLISTEGVRAPVRRGRRCRPRCSRRDDPAPTSIVPRGSRAAAGPGRSARHPTPG